MDKVSKVTQGPCPAPGCGSSDAFTEWPNGSAHCFACGYHVWPDALTTIQNLKSSLSQGNNFVHLPKDFDTYIPSIAKEWLDKYQLSDREIIRSGMGWSQTLMSLILPIRMRGEVVLYQRRYFGDDEKIPKWLTTGQKGDILYVPVDHFESNVVVLVEDIISAIKVGRIANSVPLFGSSMPLGLATRIAKRFKRARVWLDPDKRQESLKMALALSELGMKSGVILTDRDPKEYTTVDLRRYIEPFEKP